MKYHLKAIERLFYIIISFLFLGIYCNSVQPEPPVRFDKDDYLGLFAGSMKILQAKYYDANSVTDKKLIFGSIEGLLRSTGDIYADFFPPKEFKDFISSLQGNFGGIGIVFSERNDKMIVRYLTTGSPALKEGVKPGDVIYKIGNRLVDDMSLEEVVDSIRGKVGTKVKMIFRRGKKKVKKIITRQKIDFQHVVSTTLANNKIGYIKIHQFSQKINKTVRSKLIGFLKKRVRRVIIDVRTNPGGLLDEAVKLSNFFIPNGVIVHQKSRDGVMQHRAKTKNAFAKKMKLAVLVDGQTASAAEIFAGAIQDYKAGVVIGEKTYGKGTVQKLTPRFIKTQPVGLKITIAEWLTPKKHRINKNGITPDIKLPPKNYSIEQLYLVYKLEEEHMISSFIRKYPNNTEQHLKKLFYRLKKNNIPVDREIIRRMITLEKHYYQNTILPNRRYDKSLNIAIKHLLKK